MTGMPLGTVHIRLTATPQLKCTEAGVIWCASVQDMTEEIRLEDLARVVVLLQCDHLSEIRSWVIVSHTASWVAKYALLVLSPVRSALVFAQG